MKQIWYLIQKQLFTVQLRNATSKAINRFIMIPFALRLSQLHTVANALFLRKPLQADGGQSMQAHAPWGQGSPSLSRPTKRCYIKLGARTVACAWWLGCSRNDPWFWCSLLLWIMTDCSAWHQALDSTSNDCWRDEDSSLASAVPFHIHTQCPWLSCRSPFSGRDTRTGGSVHTWPDQGSGEKRQDTHRE